MSLRNLVADLLPGEILGGFEQDKEIEIGSQPAASSELNIPVCEVWTEETCMSIINAHQSDEELWTWAWSWYDQQCASGADGDLATRCINQLENVWSSSQTETTANSQSNENQAKDAHPASSQEATNGTLDSTLIIAAQDKSIRVDFLSTSGVNCQFHLPVKF